MGPKNPILIIRAPIVALKSRSSVAPELLRTVARVEKMIEVLLEYGKRGCTD